MHPFLAASLASNLSHDRVAAAAARRRRSGDGAGKVARGQGAEGALAIRRATSADSAALERLGALDSDRRRGALLGRLALEHDVLVAEVDGALVAAVALNRGAVAVADPFRPTALHTELLALRARQLAEDASAPGARRRRLVLHPRTP